MPTVRKSFLCAVVAAIDPAETVRDGVSTYRIIFEFEVADPGLSPA